MKASQPRKFSGVKVALMLYRGILGVYAVLLLANVALVTTSSAATNSADATQTINSQLCQIYGAAGYLVGVLTAVFIVWGGITYALSLGNDKGDFSIANAKTMIISALTGAFLYITGYAILQFIGLGPICNGVF